MKKILFSSALAATLLASTQISLAQTALTKLNFYQAFIDAGATPRSDGYISPLNASSTPSLSKGVNVSFKEMNGNEGIAKITMESSDPGFFFLDSNRREDLFPQLPNGSTGTTVINFEFDKLMYFEFKLSEAHFDNEVLQVSTTGVDWSLVNPGNFISTTLTGKNARMVFSDDPKAPTTSDGRPYGQDVVLGSTAKSFSVSYNWTNDVNPAFWPEDPLRGHSGFRVSVATVPEPSSAALLGLGGFALLLRRKK